jgi:gamma-aminobutyric acid type B receptor
MMFPWLFFIGFVTVFSALFAKVRRIYTVSESNQRVLEYSMFLATKCLTFLLLWQLFQHSKAFRRIKIRPIDALKPFAALFVVNIVLLVTWTAKAPWKWERVDGAGVDHFGRPTASYGSCASDKQKLAMTFGILLLVTNFIPVLLANYQTYQARSLPTQFNESKYIAYSMAVLLEATLLGLPIVILAQDDPTARFVSQSVVIFIVCLAVLVFMFVPKWLDKDKPAVKTRHVTSTRCQQSSMTSRTVEAA